MTGIRGGQPGLDDGAATPEEAAGRLEMAAAGATEIVASLHSDLQRHADLVQA